MKTTRRDRPDFIQVQLSAAGLALAGEGATLRIATAHLHYLFLGKKPVEILRRGEWPTLQRHTNLQGERLFQPFTPIPADAGSDATPTVNQAQEG